MKHNKRLATKFCIFKLNKQFKIILFNYLRNYDSIKINGY